MKIKKFNISPIQKIMMILQNLQDKISLKFLLSLFILLDLLLLFAINQSQNVKTIKNSQIVSEINSEIEQSSPNTPDDESSLLEIMSSFESEIINYIMKKGDNLVSVLMHHNVSSAHAHEISRKINRIYNLKKLAVGQEIILKLDQDSKLEELKFQNNKHKEIIAVRQGEHFNVLANPITFKKTITKVKSKINGSFIATAKKMGLTTSSIMKIVKSYSYDIDFQRDIKSGHELEVVFEKFYHKESEEFSHAGNIIYSSLNLGKKKFEIYNYKPENASYAYYRPDARSIKKSLLRTPLKVVRISSKYGMRKHPVLGYSRMHKGVDFAAPIGTPIFAAGHGVVDKIGKMRGYGNYIRIKHSNGFQTAYAHMNKFAKNMKKGRRIKQGQVIGFVGKTGTATGPHLHYEVLINGKHVNPLKIKLSPGIKLKGKSLVSFKEFKKQVTHFKENSSDKAEIDFELTNFSK